MIAAFRKSGDALNGGTRRYRKKKKKKIIA
jgi:hypothetical protein